jgi:hypothetical protein
MSDPHVYTGDEIIALIVLKAEEHAIEPWEFLGGAIAESELVPDAFRDGPWPDKSAGLFQQTVKFADEGDHSASPENIALIRQLYSDPVHACDVAARKYRYWRHDPEVPALTAWCAYNGPSFYKTPEASPNVNNYRRALDEARRILGATPMPVRFDPHYPPTYQDDDWSCAPCSLDWALRSLGRRPGHSYIEDRLVADRIVSKELGLLDGSGAALAAWIGRTEPANLYYGVDGFYGNSERSVTFDGAALEGDHAYPILIGGHNWGGPGKGPWTGVRGYDRTRDVLLLANPAGDAGDSPTFGGQEMTRAQFDARGPFSMVRVLHPSLLTPPTEEIPAAAPATWARQLEEILARDLDGDALREAIRTWLARTPAGTPA